MMGASSDPGITPRVTKELFEVLKGLGENTSYKMRVSYLQIYREVHLRRSYMDLLLHDLHLQIST